MKNKIFGFVVGVVAVVSIGWTMNAGEAWFKGVLKAGTSKVSLTNAAGNLSTTTGTFSGAVSVTGDLTVADDVIVSDVSAAATADVSSAQGGGAITNTFVRVSTSASAGDAVTLPAAAAGLVQIVCNHAAANAVDAFPASGDAINGAGANTAISLAAGECMICFAANATNWGCVIGSAT
jgi:hypothetical protein